MFARGPSGKRTLLAVAWLAGAFTAIAVNGYEWQLPRGFPQPAVPADNPMSDAKVALGRRLFFEQRLSSTGRYSCASCHLPERAFSDGRPRAIGATGDELELNAMALVNVAYNVSYGWANPELRTLEQQMLEPLLNDHPIEMGLKGREAQVITLFSEDASYRHAFEVAFPDLPAVSFENLVKAIASFERTLIFGRSAFDRYVFDGDHQALSTRAKRGMDLFFNARGGCSGCHGGFNFAGNWRDAEGDTGEPSFARNGTSDQAMRVPTLRNVALTAPYMHDGRLATLAEVLDHYSKVTPTADSRMPHHRLTRTERSELMAFLESLTDAKTATNTVE